MCVSAATAVKNIIASEVAALTKPKTANTKLDAAQ